MEWALKGSLATSMHTQNAQIYGWGVLLNAVMYLAISSQAAETVPRSLTDGALRFTASTRWKRTRGEESDLYSITKRHFENIITNHRLHTAHLAPCRAPRMQRFDSRLAAEVFRLHRQDPGDFCIPFPDGRHQRRLARHHDIREHDSWNDVCRFQSIHVSRPFTQGDVANAAMLNSLALSSALNRSERR